MLAYAGPPVENSNLLVPKVVRLILSLSQTIDAESDKDKKCKNYPHGNYPTFRACDETSTFQHIKKTFSFLPFTVTDDLRKVSNIPRKDKMSQSDTIEKF